MKYGYTQIAPAELNRINPKMLMALHNVFGIDWNKPAAVVKFAATPTKTAVLKTAEEINITGPVDVLFHRRRYNDSDRKRLYCFTVSAAGIELPEIDYEKNAGDALHHSYRKGDFDEWRKDPCENSHLTVYAVYQAKADRTPEKPITDPNEYTRYTATGETGFYNHGPKSYKLRSLDRRENVSVSIGYWYHSGKEQHDEISEIIDKSGYYVKARRESLKRRAAELKKERERARYEAQDTERDAAEIRKAADETREYIAAALMNADTAGAAAIITAIHGTWGTRYAFSEAENAIRNSRSHAYKDRATADKAKAEALNGLEKLRAIVAAAVNPAETAEEVESA